MKSTKYKVIILAIITMVKRILKKSWLPITKIMKKRQSEYKPLLFTTTLRNPERLKWFLGVLKNYNGQILTNKLAETVAEELIRIGLYKPTKLNSIIKSKIKNNISLSDKEIIKVLKDNPQNHKEAGFEKG